MSHQIFKQSSIHFLMQTVIKRNEIYESSRLFFSIESEMNKCPIKTSETESVT